MPGLVAGADASDGIAFIDAGDTIRQVHGHARQAAAYGYSGVRGLNIQLASEHVDCRLIVRRVKRHQQLASDGTEQGELFATHRHHAFIANSTLSMIEAERHRDHAIIEQTIAELKEGPLAHLPSGKYTANAARVACAVLAFNLARATAVAADMAKARWASLRKKIIKIPARIATTARRLDLHLPRDWPWATQRDAQWATATGPPATATS